MGLFWDHFGTLVPFGTKSQIRDLIVAPDYMLYLCISVHLYNCICALNTLEYNFNIHDPTIFQGPNLLHQHFPGAQFAAKTISGAQFATEKDPGPNLPPKNFPGFNLAPKKTLGTQSAGAHLPRTPPPTHVGKISKIIP